MLQNASHFSDRKILAPARPVAAWHERPLSQAIKVRNRWPFTVTAAYGAMPSLDERLMPPAGDSSFIT